MYPFISKNKEEFSKTERRAIKNLERICDSPNPDREETFYQNVNVVVVYSTDPLSRVSIEWVEIGEYLSLNAAYEAATAVKFNPLYPIFAIISEASYDGMTIRFDVSGTSVGSNVISTSIECRDLINQTLSEISAGEVNPFDSVNFNTGLIKRQLNWSAERRIVVHRKISRQEALYEGTSDLHVVACEFEPNEDLAVIFQSFCRNKSTFSQAEVSTIFGNVTILDGQRDGDIHILIQK